MFGPIGFWEAIIMLFGDLLKGVIDPIYNVWMRLRFGRIYNKELAEEHLADVIVAAKMLRDPSKKKDIYISKKGNADSSEGFLSYWISIVKTFEFCIDHKGRMFVRGVGHSGIFIERLYKDRAIRIKYKDAIYVDSFEEALDVIHDLNVYLLTK